MTSLEAIEALLKAANIEYKVMHSPVSDEHTISVEIRKDMITQFRFDYRKQMISINTFL